MRTLASLPGRRLRRLRVERFNRVRSETRVSYAAELKGNGLEIGALAFPMLLPPAARVRYVDRLSHADLCANHPDFDPATVVRPDVIDEGETLATLPPASEDFLIAAHVLEHVRNPLAALAAWCRVLKPGGYIYLVLPDKRYMFDRHRRVTTLEHLVLDYERPSSERDYEHFVDYALHVHRAVTPENAIKEADRLLAIDFSIHYHTFVAHEFRPVLDWFAQHIRPIEVIRGPEQPRPTDEFHTLLRVS